jgi:acyl-CoA thioester hydrolase
MAWDFAHPHTLQVAPQGDEIDGLSHTNNAVYVQWCERVAWAHSRALGLRLDDYRRLDRAMAIRRGEYDYPLPTTLHEPLMVATWLVGSDCRLSLQRRFQVVRERDQATVLRGAWELVCIEISSGRARRMPAEFCQAYLPAVVRPQPGP